MPRPAKKPKRDLATEVTFILDESGPGPRRRGLDVEQVKTIALALGTNALSHPLDLSSKNLGDAGAVALAKGLGKNKSMRALGLDDNGIGNVGMTALGQALKQNDYLSWLNLNGNNIGAASMRAFADALKFNKTLLFLLLERCSIDDEGAVILADVMRGNDKFERLSLNENRIGDKGATAILDVLNERNTRLKFLHLDGNHEISRTVIEALEEVLNANMVGTRLLYRKREIDLSWQRLTPEYIPQISKELAVHTKLKKLHLYIDSSDDDCNWALQSALAANHALSAISFEGDGVDDAFASAIAPALHENATIHSLVLTGGDIGHSGAVALAEMLEINSSLTHLGLSKNAVDSTNIAEITNALTRNATLTSLDLSGNDICYKGAIELVILLYQDNRALTSLNLEKNPRISPMVRKFIHDILVFNRWLKHSQGLKESVVPWAIQAVHKGNVWPRKPRRVHRSKTPRHRSTITAGIIFFLVKTTVTNQGLEDPLPQDP
jgi:Leucine Rich repeat